MSRDLRFNPLPTSTDEWLDWWEFWAKFYDTYGLPIDIMYLELKRRNYMFVDMGSEEFYAGVTQAVKMLQVGGWRKVLTKMEENAESIR